MIKRTLQELCLNITDGKHGDCENEENSGYYFISCKDIFDGQINYKKARQITKADFEETHKRTMLEVDDILLTNSGTIGRMAFVTDREATTKTTFQKSVAIIKPDKQKVLPRYLYYQLQNCVPQFINSSNGSAQKNLLLSTMRTFQIEIEENREKQEKIANTLSAYDDLIENNQKQIKLLEEAAQRLYKEWFVDLRFPGHENTKIVDGVPEEWSKNPIQDFISYEIGGGWGEELQNEKSMIPAYVIRGTDIKGLVNGQLQSVPYRYHTAGSLETRKLLDGDIVFEVSGGSKTEGVARTVRIIDLMLKTWENSVICASFCKRIKPIPSFSQYLYDSFRWMRLNGKTQEYDKKSASSIVNYRWKDFLAQEKILKPDEETISRYNNIAGTIYTKIIVCSCQIEQAKMKRDLLLPKLMNGEVEV